MGIPARPDHFLSHLVGSSTTRKTCLGSLRHLPLKVFIHLYQLLQKTSSSQTPPQHIQLQLRGWVVRPFSICGHFIATQIEGTRQLYRLGELDWSFSTLSFQIWTQCTHVVFLIRGIVFFQHLFAQIMHSLCIQTLFHIELYAYTQNKNQLQC